MQSRRRQAVCARCGLERGRIAWTVVVCAVAVWCAYRGAMRVLVVCAVLLCALWLSYAGYACVRWCARCVRAVGVCVYAAGRVRVQLGHVRVAVVCVVRGHCVGGVRVCMRGVGVVRVCVWCGCVRSA